MGRSSPCRRTGFNLHSRRKTMLIWNMPYCACFNQANEIQKSCWTIWTICMVIRPPTSFLNCSLVRILYSKPSLVAESSKIDLPVQGSMKISWNIYTVNLMEWFGAGGPESSRCLGSYVVVDTALGIKHTLMAKDPKRKLILLAARQRQHPQHRPSQPSVCTLDVSFYQSKVVFFGIYLYCKGECIPLIFIYFVNLDVYLGMSPIGLDETKFRQMNWSFPVNSLRETSGPLDETVEQRTRSETISVWNPVGQWHWGKTMVIYRMFQIPIFNVVQLLNLDKNWNYRTKKKSEKTWKTTQRCSS